MFAKEVPRIYEFNWKAAVFSGLENVEVQFWWFVLGSFEKVFGNKFLCGCVYILVLYAVYELCLTLDGVRIFILAL